MTIDKHGNKYRIRHTQDGKTYSITVDKKPTMKEAQRLINIEIANCPNDVEQMEFWQAIEKYVEEAEMGIAQKREYTRLHNRLPDWFNHRKLYQITQADLDRLVKEIRERKNRYGEPLSPKSVKTYYHQVLPILKKYVEDVEFNTTLPVIHKKCEDDVYIPCEEDVRKLIEYAKANEPDYVVPVILGSFGLRRGEIIPITKDDVRYEGEICLLSISKAVVVNENGEVVEKDTKTVYSKREIAIPKFVADYIVENDGAYNGYIGNVGHFVERAENALGFENKFSFHKLRHYFLSKLLKEGVDFQTALYLGGWSKSSKVAREIYSHSLNTKNAEKKNEIANMLISSIC